MIAPEDVFAQAREWLGVRFVHQGRSRHGCDCLGFIAAFMQELGSDTLMNALPRAYGRAPQSLLVDGLPKITREVALQPGALLLIQFPVYPWPSHAAIYTGSSMIHSVEAAGKVVEHSYGRPWKPRTVSTWALPLVRYEPQGDAPHV
jgi:cell wall-associated NlpC family hydrolase